MIMNPETRHASSKMTAILAAFLILVMTGPAAAAGDEDQQGESKYTKGVKQCMTCHKEGKERPAHEIFFTEMGITGDPDSPFAEGNHDCEACHGPASQHLKKQPDGSRLPPPLLALTFAKPGLAGTIRPSSGDFFQQKIDCKPAFHVRRISL